MHGCTQSATETQERDKLPLGEIISEDQGAYEEEGELESMMGRLCASIAMLREFSSG